MLVGLDLVEVGRFERALERHPGLLERVFTPAEIAYCRARARPAVHLAVRFAAKEAVGKLLGQGVLVWKDIEILAGGAPRVVLYGSTAEAAKRLGITSIAVSLSHTKSMAGACVVALRSEG